MPPCPVALVLPLVNLAHHEVFREFTSTMVPIHEAYTRLEPRQHSGRVLTGSLGETRPMPPAEFFTHPTSGIATNTHLAGLTAGCGLDR